MNYIRLLQLQISVTEDLKHLFILLIRNYNPAIQSRQYLQDLIVTNHILLLIPDRISQAPDPKNHKKLMEHIEQYDTNYICPRSQKVNSVNFHLCRFATTEIMQQYGFLLENFNENGEYVNDCIFTMMHHIGGMLVTTLFQPIILKTYSSIWESDYELCDVSQLSTKCLRKIESAIICFSFIIQDWHDLIEYVIHKFINTPQQASLITASPTSDVEMTMTHDIGEGFW